MVKMVYRGQIKIHYATQQLASQDGYLDYDKKLDMSKGGIVYPFTGIRGDAKEIWNRLKRG